MEGVGYNQAFAFSTGVSCWLWGTHVPNVDFLNVNISLNFLSLSQNIYSLTHDSWCITGRI